MTIEELRDYVEEQRSLNNIPYHVYSELIDGIDTLEQEPKAGHWILARTFPTQLYDECLNEYKCSECYRKIRCTESQLVNYPYCHCGAKMESEEV